METLRDNTGPPATLWRRTRIIARMFLIAVPLILIVTLLDRAGYWLERCGSALQRLGDRLDRRIKRIVDERP